MACTTVEMSSATQKAGQEVQTKMAGDASLAFRSAEEILSNYLCSTPLALALYRSAEVNQVRKLVIGRPVLDLGCGFGQFASLALKEPVDMGLDISGRVLALAAERRCYKELHRGDARVMPFEDGRFQSVISISALEHIRHPEAVAREVFRVLRPGGLFVATLVLADIHTFLFYPAVLRWLRLAPLARGYERLHDKVFKHETLLKQHEWEKAFSLAGFEIVQSKKIISPRATRWFDALLLSAWPYRLAIRFGCSLVWRPKWAALLAGRLFAPVVAEDAAEGSNLLLVARKPDEATGYR